MQGWDPQVRKRQTWGAPTVCGQQPQPTHEPRADPLLARLRQLRRGAAGRIPPSRGSLPGLGPPCTLTGPDAPQALLPPPPSRGPPLAPASGTRGAWFEFAKGQGWFSFPAAAVKGPAGRFNLFKVDIK